MSGEEAKVLEERALSFLRNAKRLIEERELDLAAFSVEQSCQLILKQRLLVKTGTYPRTHSVVRLLRELDTAVPGKGLLKFVDSEMLLLTKVEDAYIVSRYVPRRYERKEAEALVAFADRLMTVLRDV
ncbi:MAG: HEPN domain-containing protein [Conexivisphaerales archaeon]|jgi:HEPN domain-containing protein